MKRVGIIGAGRFGLSLAESLSEAGIEVLLFELLDEPDERDLPVFAIISRYLLFP